MADVFVTAQTSEVALVAATVKTVLQIASPVNRRLRVRSWGVFFDGTSETNEPVQVELLRQTTGGTMSALTLVDKQDSGETIQTAATQNASAEPTAGAILDMAEVHPQAGYEKFYHPGEEVKVAGGSLLGIRCTAPAGVNVRAKIEFEE